MSTSPTFSIIIPHHNIPDLLQRLLDSIPQREDTEVIVVDDNSSPDKVDFDNFPGKDRKDVKIIFDRKGGFGGYARNLALDVARGKWLLFADADDYFNYCMSDVLDEYANAQADIVYFKASSVDTDSYTLSYRCFSQNKRIDLYLKDERQGELQLRYKFGEPWCKLVRHAIVKDHNIRFEERSIHNDTAFSYLVGHYAKTIAVDQRALYCITTREGSVSRELSEKKKLERIENFASSSLFFQKNNIPVKEYWHFIQLYKCRCEKTETYDKAVEILKSLGYTESEISAGLRRGRWELLKRRTKAKIRGILRKLLARYNESGNIVIPKRVEIVDY